MGMTSAMTFLFPDMAHASGQAFFDPVQLLLVLGLFALFLTGLVYLFIWIAKKSKSEPAKYGRARRLFGLLILTPSVPLELILLFDAWGKYDWWVAMYHLFFVGLICLGGWLVIGKKAPPQAPEKQS